MVEARRACWAKRGSGAASIGGLQGGLRAGDDEVEQLLEQRFGLRALVACVDDGEGRRRIVEAHDDDAGCHSEIALCFVEGERVQEGLSLGGGEGVRVEEGVGAIGVAQRRLHLVDHEAVVRRRHDVGPSVELHDPVAVRSLQLNVDLAAGPPRFVQAAVACVRFGAPSSAQMAEGLDPADARARELDRLSNGDVDAAGVGVDVHLVIRSVSSWRAHLTPNSEPSGTSPSQTV